MLFDLLFVSSAAFSGHRRGAAWEVEQLGYGPALLWDVSAYRWRITPSNHGDSSSLFIKIYFYLFERPGGIEI